MDGSATRLRAATLYLEAASSQALKREELLDLFSDTLVDKIDCEEVARDGGFLVVPIAQGTDRISTYLRHVPERYLTAVREKRSWLVFDHSGEGPNFHRQEAQRIHAALNDMGIAPAQVIYINQSRDYGPDYSAWCNAQAVDQRFHVLLYDYYIKRFFLRSWDDRPAEFARRRQAFLQRDRLGRAFVCLNFKPRPWRTALLTWIIRDGLWDRGFISFGGFDRGAVPMIEGSIVWSKSGGPIQQFLDLAVSEGCEAPLAALVEKGRIFFANHGKDATGRNKGRLLDMAGDIYRQSAFSLVSETAMMPTMRRISEKPCRALSNGHPLILFGGFRNLQLIRNLGFQTFSDWIDEGYDEISDPESRFRAAYGAFQDFLPRAETAVLTDKKLQDLLLFNLEHAFFGIQKKYDSEIDPAFCDALRRAAQD